jgi:hypothetical protein
MNGKENFWKLEWQYKEFGFRKQEYGGDKADYSQGT